MFFATLNCPINTLNDGSGDTRKRGWQKTTARKQTGSFYTTHEIVNYMVDESIIAHLRTNLNDDDEAEDTLHRIISYSIENPFNEDESKHIIELIDCMKILDPACGSGAFPMGVLQKLVHLLQKLDDGNAIWEDRQLDRINRELQNVIDKTEKAEIRTQMRDVIEAFTENDPDYSRILFLIENCIYGVDFQPIATQISKLRYFISLIVDQKIDR